MITKIKVAVLQMDCVFGDVQANMQGAEKLIYEAAQKGARLMVLPEFFNTGYLADEKKYGESLTGDTIKTLHAQAQNYDCAIVACMIEKEHLTYYDTAFIITPEGLQNTYRKQYLWGNEPNRFARGNAYGVQKIHLKNTPELHVGLQICYEIGFPEGARVLSLRGANLLIYSSAFGAPRRYVWDIASRARALENGLFVLAANRSGSEKVGAQEVVFAGASRIISPQGAVLGEASKNNEAVVCEIDLNEVTAQRNTIPYLRDLNKKLYEDFL